jgi:hypothetical protein
MRHGEAGRHAQDDQRELTDVGRQQVARVAAQLAESDSRPELIWCSPLVRARQTAAIVAEILNCPVEEKRFITPDDDPAHCLGALSVTTASPLLLVSHMPLVGVLTSLLTDGHRRGAAFVTAQAVLLDMPVVGPGCADLKTRFCPDLHRNDPLREVSMSQQLIDMEPLATSIPTKGLPPLQDWHPPLSGDMEMRIDRSCQWRFKGNLIGREALVKLFSSILRLEDDGEYYLISPVEKWRIQVDDTPLLAHSLTVSGRGEQQTLTLTTNVGEILSIGADHPLQIETYRETGEPRPLITVRHGAQARLVTAAYYELVDLAVERLVDGETVVGVFSEGNFYKLAVNG